MPALGEHVEAIEISEQLADVGVGYRRGGMVGDVIGLLCEPGNDTRRDDDRVPRRHLKSGPPLTTLSQRRAGLVHRQPFRRVVAQFLVGWHHVLPQPFL